MQNRFLDGDLDPQQVRIFALESTLADLSAELATIQAEIGRLLAVVQTLTPAQINQHCERRAANLLQLARN